MTQSDQVDPATLRYDDRGLLPVVVQGVATGAVLMVAWADRRAVELTLRTGQAHFFSRSRQELWRKGATSGNVLEVAGVAHDCDADTLLVRAHPAGPACHEGTRTCFGEGEAQLELGWLYEVLKQRKESGSVDSYTARLLAEGTSRVAQKVGEEGVETALAGALHDGSEASRGRLIGETADLLYHVSALLVALDVSPLEVAKELERRHLERTGPAGSASAGVAQSPGGGA